MDEKLQKVLARAGYGSRREVETWIAAGRVSVNSRTATIGDRVGPADTIRVDGRPLRLEQVAPRRRVLAYHKPIGEVATRSDPEGRPTVFDSLPRLRNSRWVPIGRLDLNTAGLLLFTTDGELAHRLMHPSSEVEREYAVRVLGPVDPEVIERLTRGVELEDGPAHFDAVVDGGGSGANHWYHVILKEGRKREVRRLWASQGVTVSRLLRVRYGPVRLERALRPGKFRDLDAVELAGLLSVAGMAPTPPDPKSEGKRRPGGRGAPRRPGGAVRPRARRS